jgi:prepilin-type N-terminal cleavage/methylation domain-containing protein
MQQERRQMRSNGSKRRLAGNRDRRATERGFTLIETSIAMVIMMVAALGVVSLFTFAIGYNSGGNDRAVAISIAQQELEQLRGVPFTDPLLTTAAASDTVSNGRSYRVTKTVIGANNDTKGNPTLKTITIQVNPLSPGWAGFPVILRTIRTR